MITFACGTDWRHTHGLVLCQALSSKYCIPPPWREVQRQEGLGDYYFWNNYIPKTTAQSPRKLTPPFITRRSIKVLTKAGQWNVLCAKCSAFILSNYLRTISILSSNLNLPNSILLLGYPSTNFVCIYPLYHAYLCNFEYIGQGGVSVVNVQTLVLWILQNRIPATLVAFGEASLPRQRGEYLETCPNCP